MPEHELKAIFGEAYEAETDAINYQALSQCRLTQQIDRKPGLERLPTPNAQVFTWEDFLSGDDCQKTMELIDQNLKPSTVTGAQGETRTHVDTRVRTSSTCTLGLQPDPFVLDLNRRISATLGIHWSYSEAIQGQKYEVGQEFKSHTDYFEPGAAEYLPNTAERGQRTWTFMIYLNSTPEGGETWFPRLEKLFHPKQGMAVIWNNLNADGSVNPYTLHHGMKPRQGEKYIITKWFRERGWGPMFEDPGFSKL